MSTGRIRVLVVDDSAFARKVLSNVLNAEQDLEVIATARDGLEALEKIAELRPDVVTLDLVMPQLDGVGVLDQLQTGSAPPVVVVSMSDAESELGVRALQLGAVDLVHKPTALATDRLYELGAELVKKVRAAAQAKPRPAPPIESPPAPDCASAPVQAPLRADHTDVIVLGTSTGGPQALTRVIATLPATLPVPVLVVLHIPASYTGPLAERLDRISALQVREAEDGMPLSAGSVVIARGDRHLRVERSGSRLAARLSATPAHSLHRPSVDELFRSAAAACGRRALGVVLTGMGEDGLQGARELVARGGRVITEAQSTCVIHGMPRSVLEAGLSHRDVALDKIVPTLCELL